MNNVETKRNISINRMFRKKQQNELNVALNYDFNQKKNDFPQISY